MDGKPNLTSEDDTRRHPTDGQEPTHNRLFKLLERYGSAAVEVAEVR
jgi:hypothetical protein